MLARFRLSQSSSYNMIKDSHSFIAGLAGRRRNLYAFGFGVLATLALPPVFALPLLIPSFTGLFWLIDAAPTRRRVFLDGWWWGWGYYISGLYWFCVALLTDAERFAWMIPFALFGVTAVIAIYAGLACWLAARTRTQGVLRIFTFSVIWAVIEYARGHFFTGFPWNLTGYVFTVSDAMLQPASVIGVYGLTWWAVWLATIPAALIYGTRRAIAAVALSYFLFAVTVAWGYSRLAQADGRNVPGVTLRLVQANIAQHHKWEPASQLQGLHEHARLTALPGIESITHVIWPETAVPYVIKEGAPLTRLLGNSVPPQTLLITGALREDAGGERWQIWNSLMVIDHNGKIIGAYDKRKLVPFGEFVPFRYLLPAAWLTPVGPTDFSSGAGLSVTDWPGLPTLRPLICYEAIFPELSGDGGKRPRFLLNVTNDAWFGMSSGPYQHFHMSRVRAVEQGLPLVRVANTGITAVTDAYGQVVSKLGLGEKGIIDVSLPEALEERTVYGHIQNGFLLLLILVNILLVLAPAQHERFIKFLLQVVPIRK
jgi:apolipoprotein N-acyltransferase